MLRVAVGSAMGAIGYLLVYAAVTAGGTFALRPWDALSASAPWPVTSSASSSPPTSSGGGGVVSKAEGIGRKILGLLPFGLGL